MTDQIEITTDPQTMALLRNDLRGLTKDQIGELVAALTERMGIDPMLAPIDLIVDKKSGKITPYLNARGAAELAKRHDLSDEDLDVDVRTTPPVVIVKVAKASADGRVLRDVGASSYQPDWPDSLARAIKTATTSAHRRATLRMVGIFISEPESLEAVNADA